MSEINLRPIDVRLAESATGRFLSARSRAACTTIVALTASMLLTGCAGDDTTATSAETSTDASGSVPTEYDGPEDGLPTSYPSPAGLKDCTVGYLNAVGSAQSLAREQSAAEAEVKDLGCDFIGLDANGDVNAQLSQFKQLLAQDVDAIIAYPLDPGALGQVVEEAASAGIPVIANNTPADATSEVLDGYLTDFLEGLDRGIFTRVQALAAADPGAKFAILGTGIPAPAIQYYEQREEFWGKEFGLEYLGKVSAPSTSATDTTTAMSGIVGKYPDVDAVMTINDEVAIAASALARRSDRSDIRILGAGGQEEGVQAVEDGQIFATYKVNFEEIGRQLARAAVTAISDPTSVPPRAVVIPGELIVGDND